MLLSNIHTSIKNKLDGFLRCQKMYFIICRRSRILVFSGSCNYYGLRFSPEWKLFTSLSTLNTANSGMYIKNIFNFNDMSQFQNVQFCSRSRKEKILTTGIHWVFRGLKFEPDADIGQKGAFWNWLIWEHSASFSTVSNPA